jgi:dihydroneopterin aldolase
MTNGNGGNLAIAPRVVADATCEVTLDVEAIRLSVHLGCEPGERRVAQEVEVKVGIRFAAVPAACWTDDLADTVCYAELAALAREHCAGREFRLIERLALELHDLFRSRLPRGARLSLTVDKLAPPVAELARGVRFTIAERP